MEGTAKKTAGKSVLEHLRHIRSRVDQIADDMSDLKHRISGLAGES